MVSDDYFVSSSAGDKRRVERFHLLIEQVQSCQLCPRMDGRARVFGAANGPICSRIVFIAEAPGRFGADRSHIPLYGDQTGHNFDLLLRAAELDRSTIFITNAVLCNPRDEHGRNASPTRREVHACSSHLCTTLAILHPAIVVTLGRVALDAIGMLAPHRAQLARDVGQPRLWNQCILIPLYHPGPRACMHRPLARQVQDYTQLGRFIKEYLQSA